MALICQVLLFCTMTRLLDIVEEHLEWRGLVSVRLEGATAAEERGPVCLTLRVEGGSLDRRKPWMWMCTHADICGSCCACSVC